MRPTGGKRGFPFSFRSLVLSRVQYSTKTIRMRIAQNILMRLSHTKSRVELIPKGSALGAPLPLSPTVSLVRSMGSTDS